LKLFGDILNRDSSGDSREEPEPEPSPSRMQWVKNQLTYAGTHILGINGVSQTGSPVRVLPGNRAFSRNDSSNSNTSCSQYSGTESYFPFGGTPPRTPPP